MKVHGVGKAGEGEAAPGNQPELASPEQTLAVFGTAEVHRHLVGGSGLLRMAAGQQAGAGR